MIKILHLMWLKIHNYNVIAFKIKSRIEKKQNKYQLCDFFYHRETTPYLEVSGQVYEGMGRTDTSIDIGNMESHQQVKNKHHDFTLNNIITNIKLIITNIPLIIFHTAFCLRSIVVGTIYVCI